MKSFLPNIKNNIICVLKKKEAQIFVVTLVLHSLFVLFLAYTNFTLFSNVSDNIFYHESGSAIAELIKEGNYKLGDVYPHHWFPLFIGGLYFIFGAHMIIGSLVNAILVAGTAVLFYRILREYGVTEKVAFFGSLVVLNGYASFMYHSSILLKEAWITFLLIISIYFSVLIIKGKGSRRWLFGALLVIFIFLRSLRFFIGFAAMATFFIDWFLNVHDKLLKKISRGLGMIVIVCAVVILLQGIPVIGGHSIFKALNINIIHKTHTDSAKLGSTSIKSEVIKEVAVKAPAVNIHTVDTKPLPEEVVEKKYAFSVSGLLISLSTIIIGPFPWQLPMAKYIPLFVDIVFVIILFILSCIAVLKSRYTVIKTLAPLIIISGIIFTGIAFGTDNIGAIIRQRIPGVVVMAIIALIGFDILFKKYVLKR